MIHCADVIKRMNNEKLFHILYVLEHAIKKCRKVCFLYKKTRRDKGRMTKVYVLPVWQDE